MKDKTLGVIGICLITSFIILFFVLLQSGGAGIEKSDRTGNSHLKGYQQGDDSRCLQTGTEKNHRNSENFNSGNHHRENIRGVHGNHQKR